MLNSNSNTPLFFDIKANNMNSLACEQSESSTGDSNPNGECSKYLKEIVIPKIDIKYKKGKKKSKSKSKKNTLKLEKLLNKKTKRNTNSKYIKKDNIIINIFNEFKSNSSLYKKFPKFHIIEKNVKNGLYSSSLEFSKDVRKIFSSIFSSFLTNLDYSKYNQALIFSEIFEKIYAKYDCDSYAKKASHLFEKISKLKKEINKIEIETSGKTGKFLNKEKKNSEKKKGITIEKYKEDISNNIQKLNIEQKKGILKIISNNLIDKNKENNTIEFNINKLPYNQLKQLDKYINQCINNNNEKKKDIINQVKNYEISKNYSKEEKKQNNAFNEDVDFSSYFSGSEYDDNDLE